MANHWTNKYAIWQDLSVAQGREVPVEIDNTVIVAQDERPPPLPIIEDTEDEFYANYVGAGDSICGPDLDLISKMLQEVSRPTDATLTEEPPTLCPVGNASVSMFKRKEKKRDLENGLTSTPKPSDPEAEQPRPYVPSARAADYYSRFHEQNRARELREESIWTIAERQMKQLDVKRYGSGQTADASPRVHRCFGLCSVRSVL
ncbi:uncharacterized protein LOC120629529 isoform X2 [Pararge aegeria]|nr:uncharacterized protein LOC120629529 isoform X2 [Pararge aegeria]